MIAAPNLSTLDWVVHGFGLRDSRYPPGIRLARQIHSGIVLDADAGPQPGSRGDALVCRQPGSAVGIRTADCVPILIADAASRSVAAIHAGWRGTAASIAPAAVREMMRRFGTRPGDLRAAIGPAIGGCCYEVGPEVALELGVRSRTPIRVDLRTINERQLRDLGIENIWRSEECTFCEAARFFSFRRDRDRAGRMISFIGVRGTADAGGSEEGPEGG